MPNLSAVLNDEAFNGLDESLKTFYHQNSETKEWWLGVDDPGKLDVSGAKELERLRNHNKTVLGEKKTAAEKLAAFEALGKTADEIKAALEANQPENVTKMVADYEAKLEQLKASYEGPMAELKTQNEKLLAEQDQAAVKQAIQKAARDFDLDGELAEFILPSYLKPVRDDNGVAVKVFENGNEAIVAGEPKTIEKLVKEFRESKKHLKMFNAGEGGGTGASNRMAATVNGSKVMKRTEFESMANDARFKFIREGGTLTD